MQARRLLLATANPSKAREIAAALAELDCEILTLADLKNRVAEPPESGKTFAENARIKAEFWARESGMITLADDSGILVEALPGELGVQTVRFGAGEKASDAEWLAHFLERMRNAKTRRAKFVCVIAVAVPEAATRFFEGEVAGTITEKAEAPLLPRIPLSSVFLADGADKVFAAMNATEKARFSHRGRALVEAQKFLTELLKSAS